MSQLTGKDKSDLIKELHGVIFKDSADNIRKMSDGYLSENVRRKEAVHMVEKSEEYYYDIILTDIRMHVMDGFTRKRQLSET